MARTTLYLVINILNIYLCVYKFLQKMSMSVSPCPCRECPCLHVSMSQCLHVSMFHVCVSMFPCLNVSTFSEFRKLKKEVTEIGNFPVSAGNGKLKRQTSVCLSQTETEKNKSWFSLTDKR
jgi:hypothetical protein